MPIQFDKFDQQKVDRIKTHLEAQASKGNAKFFEIYVDSLKAVQKTDEPKEFDGYEDYMTAETNQIKIVIYNSGSSPRNDQYVFSLRAKSPQEALENALDGIALSSLTKSELIELKEKREAQLAESQEIQRLHDEIDGLLAEREEREKYISQMEKGLEIAKDNGNKIGGVKIGDILSDALEGLVRRNTSFISQIPGLDGVAALIEKDTEEKQNSGSDTQQGEATFKKKNPTQDSYGLSEQEKQFLELYKQIQKYFSEEELNQVIEIIDRLTRAKDKILVVLELLRK